MGGAMNGAEKTQAEKVAYWTEGYNLWKALPKAGEDRPWPKDAQIFEDSPCCGFWRKQIKERDAKGNSKRTGWTAIAIFMNGGVLTGRINGEDLTGDNLVTLWSYCARNPVTEEMWRAVVERGEPWPDALDAKTTEVIPAANREVERDDNKPPEVAPDVEHATKIDNAIAAARKTVANEAEAAQALGSKNRIAELRLAADKVGKAIYQPLHQVYIVEQKKWSAIVNRAEAEEKRLNTAILTFRESERRRIAAEESAAAAKQREIDEANRVAAEKAADAGRPAPPPVAPVEAPKPTSSTPIAPTYGTRKLKEDVKKWAVIDDASLVYQHFAGNIEVQALLKALAQSAIRAGQTVPGAHFVEGLIEP